VLPFFAEHDAKLLRVLTDRGSDVWLGEYNEWRPHQGRWCFGKTPIPRCNADDEGEDDSSLNRIGHQTRSLNRYPLSDPVSANTP
jgi:hypothetical protein